MKDNEFEKLLQDSIRLYGHEYPELPTNDISEIHRFPDNFIDDILPHTKPKKPFILRHIRAISAAAAVMVIGLAAVMIFSKSGTNNMNNMIDKSAKQNSSVSIIENNTAAQESKNSTSGPSNSGSKEDEPQKAPVSEQKGDPIKSGDTDHTGTISSEVSGSAQTEDPAETSYEPIHEVSEEPVYESSEVEHENMPVEPSGETPVEVSEEIPAEESGEIPVEVSGEPTPDISVIDDNYSFRYQDDADDPVNNSIRDILAAAKEYMTDSYDVDISSIDPSDIKLTYIFRPVSNSGINIGGTSYSMISLSETDSGYLIAAMQDADTKFYLMTGSESELRTVASALEYLSQ